VVVAASPVVHHVPTNRARRHARAIPVRGERRLRISLWPRTPLAAALLSLVAFASPTLTLAPLNASAPRAAGPQPIDEIAQPIRGPRPLDLVDSLIRSVAPPTVPDVVAVAPRFQAALDAARAEAAAYGVTFAAVRDGELLWSGSSGRARDGSTALSPGSELVIGSVTKTFVAAGILQLVEEGRVELDDPVRDHLPHLGDLSREITLAELLDHTSGLADLFNDTTRTGLEEHPEHAWTADEILGALHAPWYAPGEGWAYANTNYYLLGMVIERITGRSLADELDRRFLTPLGLEATHLLDGTVGGPLEPAWTTIFWASGAMTSSAADLARWGDALYGGTVLDASTRRAMLRLNSHDYGLGVQLVEVDGESGFGHTGLLNTYTTLLYHVPAEGVTIALLVNRSHVDLGAMLAAEPADGPSLLELALHP
jgi:D-alanyl-D-alanine carboxypeptidase